MWRQCVHVLFRLSRSDKSIPQEYLHVKKRKDEEGICKMDIESENPTEIMGDLKPPALQQIV